MSSSRLYYYLALIGVVATAITRQWEFALGTVPWLAFHSAGTTVSLMRRGQVLKAIAWLCMVAWFDSATTIALALGAVRNRRLVL